MSQQSVKENWDRIKSQVQSKWNNLTAEEIESTHGDAKAMSELLQRKYGISESEALEQFQIFYSNFEEPSKEFNAAKDDDVRNQQPH